MYRKYAILPHSLGWVAVWIVVGSLVFKGFSKHF